MIDSTALERTTRTSGVSVRSAPLGGSALSRALRDDRLSHGIRALLARAPHGVDGWRERVQETRGDQGYAGWHERLAPALGARMHSVARARLNAAAASGVVVTTGQQPGLFGGPTYTFSKAMSALAFADALQEQLDVPVAPVFWAATDDADWRETASTSFLRRDGLATVALRGPATDAVPVSDVPLGPLDAPLRELVRASGAAATASVLDVVRDAYRPDRTIGDAYVMLLRRLLEPMGIAVLDAAHDTVRVAAHSVLAQALRSATAINESQDERCRIIRDEGFGPQVEIIDALSMVFEYEKATADGRATTVKRRVAVSEAARRADSASPGTLGPNVLLRPVVERAILPTVAYHAGPGEYAYFAQTSAVADVLGLSQPVAVPRWSGEVIETHSDELRESLSIDEPALLSPHGPETALARAALDDSVGDAIERLRVALETQTRVIASATRDVGDLVPTRVIDGLEQSLAHRVGRFERRVIAATKRREVELMANIAHVRAAFRPLGESPERVLNLMPFLARFGLGVLSDMREAASTHAQTLIRGDANG